MNSVLDRSVTTLSGVGPAKARQLLRLGINTVKDLLYFFPRAYENRADIRLLCEVTPDVNVATVLTVGSAVSTAKINSRLTISKFKAFDDSGSCEVVFFNSPFVKDVFKVGAEYRFYGKFQFSRYKVSLNSPKYEPYVEGIPLPDLIPVYHATEGINSKFIQKLLIGVIDEAASSVLDPLPEWIRLKCSLPTLSYAIRNAHFPKSEKELSGALRRLAFDEMFTFGVAISLGASRKRRCEGEAFLPTSLKPVTDLLPYELTVSQKNAVNDIYRDTVLTKNEGKTPSMSRVIVGDVGSGKTVCAVLSAYLAVRSGFQTAVMVPTEILARQHFQEFDKILGELGIKCELLLGSTTAKEKRRIYAECESGDISVIIGTHALISDKLSFKALGLVITDEQHRFGVVQRSVLKERAKSCHMLVMSATPIPRTLALALYGDLDISRITELPPGRQRVDTFVVDEGYRPRLNDFIDKQVKMGGQCYVVCPAIEGRDDEGDYIPTSITNPFVKEKAPEMKNATEHTENLRRALPHLRIACMHGKMKAAEKDAVMKDFAEGRLDVLVSTTVIEVGVNVPNATLMVIENAERFGLSQLHQLRGRVGRSPKKSYCVLVSDSKGESALSRLNTMRSVYDGYEIAEKDLVLRGPGDFFSSNSANNFRQSGGFDFKFAKLCDDTTLVDLAFSMARELVSLDAELSSPDHALLKAAVEEKLDLSISVIS